MSDVWQQLPFSQRRAGADESSVSNDWRPHTARALTALADLLDAMPTGLWDSPTLTPHRSGTAPTVEQTAADLARALAPHRPLQTRPAPPAGRSAIIAALRAAAQGFAEGRGRKGLRALTIVAQHAYDITVPLDLPDPIEPRASGAVALGLAATAPTPLRAVITGRSLVADDADWLIGAGRGIRGSAGQLVSWLGGRDITPHFDPPRSPDEVAAP